MFEKLRNNILKNYGLCPSHHLITPGLRWDAMLQITKIKLITDTDMHIYFEKGTRGEISYISDRYSEANNKCFKSYNQNKNQNILNT